MGIRNFNYGTRRDRSLQMMPSFLLLLLVCPQRDLALHEVT